MNSSAIRELRQKFIAIAMASFFLVIMFTGGATALASQYSLRSQASQALDLIMENEGELPEQASLEDNASPIGLYRLFPEFNYAARYFTVLLDPSGKVDNVDVRHIAAVDEGRAIAYAREAVESYDNVTVSLLNMGSVDTFYYRVAERRNGQKFVAFFDCSQQMQVNREVSLTTVRICGISLIGSFLLVLYLSKRAIRPEIEYARKQKQFITNASHELKTPLAVIRANTEITEMLQGETEWTRSTMGQVDRMDGLVQNLVMIARAEEREDRSTTGDIDVCKVVARSVDPFQAMAHQEHKELVCELDEDVHMIADASAIQQLCTLLVDNALKYCDEDGRVVVSVAQPRRGRVTLAVANSFASGQKAQFNRFFERFYRDDEAHSDEGGYGIGLSVAESICTRYRGSIKATWKDGMAVFTCLLRSV